MKTSISILLSFSLLLSLSAQNIPIDFEDNGNGAEWQWTVFENDSNPPLEIIDNPDPSGANTSSKVAKFTALTNGQPFAGCESLHGGGIGTFTIDASNSTIRIKVWKSVISDVGIKLVRVDNFSLGEIKIPNTKVNEWEELTFDFSAHIGNNYDQIVIFPDFAGRSSDNVIYFDDVYGDGQMTSSTSKITNLQIELYPNPASDWIEISADQPITSYQIYGLDGQVVQQSKSNSAINNINIRELAAGTYIFSASYEGKKYVKQFVKE